MAEPFAAVWDFQDAFGPAASSTQMDLEAASQDIRDYCQWDIWPQVTETLVLDGPGTDVLLVPTLRLSEVTGVSETFRGVGQTATTLDVADLEWSSAGMVWKSSGRCWTSRARGISITLTHGYATPPANIVKLTLAIAKRSADNPAGGLSSRTVGSRSESYSSAGGSMLLDEKASLDAYRRIV